MYQHLNALFGQTSGQASREEGLAPTAEQLETIRARLDRQIPEGPYVGDEHLARILLTHPKSLRNRRSSGRFQIPRPIRLAGSRRPVHVRSELIEWLATEELRAKLRSGRQIQ
jgi:hypothetical protein